MILITFLLVVSTTFSAYARLDGCGTEDWTPYKDKKCIYVSTEDLGSFETIETFCAKKEKSDDIKSCILTVTTAEEQEFVANLLFKKRNDIVNDIWLGAQYDKKSKDFRWRADFERGIELLDELDKKKDNFANWQEEPENNQNQTNKNNCVEMIGSDKAQNGKWRVVSCSKNNIAVCEKPQVWSTTRQQAELLKIQKQNKNIYSQNEKMLAFQTENEKMLSAQNEKLLTIQAENQNMLQNLIPIGFIYIQWPKEKRPEIVWSSLGYNWTEVSDDYLGVFLRVVGDDAETFGIVQEQKSPVIDQVKGGFCYKDAEDKKCSPTQYYNGKYEEVNNYARIEYDNKAWSQFVWSSQYNYPGIKGEFMVGDYLSFRSSGDPVRPRNMAIKVWKRTG